jgi:hypothetical protein
MTQQTISPIRRIVATGIILWIVAVVLPSYLLFYLDFGPLFIDIIVAVFIVYFIVVPIIVILLLVIDLIQFVRRWQLRFVNQAWYLLLLVFAILSILSSFIMYNSLSVFDPLWSSYPVDSR